MKLLLVYLIVINLALFVTMGADKRAARRGGRRVPERTLFALAVIGGAPGGTLGMLAFRHKTRKPMFFIGFPLLTLALILVLWICAPELAAL